MRVQIPLGALMISMKRCLEGLEKKEKAFVLFYAEWCPFCKSFMPTFDRFSKENPGVCAKVDVYEMPDESDKYSIEYYPTVILFKNGRVHARLDAVRGVGIEKKKFDEFCKR